MLKFKNNNKIVLKPGVSSAYLKSLGIEDIESFLYKPKPSDYEDPYDLDNMEDMIDRLHKGFEEKKRFFVQVDSDCDGYTSSAIFINYFNNLYPDCDIVYRLHEGKQHGIIANTVPVDRDIVVIPDAGSNQLDEDDILTAQGRELLIIDHHLVDNVPQSSQICFVNNQSSKNFKNKALSGAGVMLKVIEAYDRKYGERFDYKKYEDLAALGIIADCMDTRTIDNNAIIQNGLNNINNSLLQQLMAKGYANKNKCNTIPFALLTPEEKKDFSTKMSIAFYVAPMINAVVRTGTNEEKERFFEGFIKDNSEEVVKTTWRGTQRTETIFEYLVRCAVNLRAKQNRQKDKSLGQLVELIEKQKLDSHKIILIPLNDNITINKNITGLAAMEIMKKYNKPTLLLRPVLDGGVKYFRGSGRASAANGFKSFAAVLKKSGLMDYVQGHDNAFGASIEEKLIPDLLAFVDEELKNVDFLDNNEVDGIMTDENWDITPLRELGEISFIYGQGIPEPNIYFNFSAHVGDCRIQGSKRNSFKIQHNGVGFVAFNCPELIAKYEKITSNSNLSDLLNVEIIGTANINKWNGYKNVQIFIKDIDFKTRHEENLGF